MNRTARQSVIQLVPVAVLSLAASLPMAAAAEMAGSVAAVQHSTRLVISPDRAEALARCVTQVVKRLCGSQHATLERPTAIPAMQDAQAIAYAARPDEPHRPATPVLLQHIDLPPPAVNRRA